MNEPKIITTARQILTDYDEGVRKWGVTNQDGATVSELNITPHSTIYAHYDYTPVKKTVRKFRTMEEICKAISLHGDEVQDSNGVKYKISGIHSTQESENKISVSITKNDTSRGTHTTSSHTYYFIWNGFKFTSDNHPFGIEE